MVYLCYTTLGASYGRLDKIKLEKEEFLSDTTSIYCLYKQCFFN